MKYLKDVIIISICIVILIFCIVELCNMFNKHNYKPPVKNITNIDSIYIKNDSINNKIKSLDSIKNEKIIEVLTLNDDSTIKLFYKLVSK